MYVGGTIHSFMTKEEVFLTEIQCTCACTCVRNKSFSIIIMKSHIRVYAHVCTILAGSLQSLDWNGGLEWWNGMVESQIQQK